MKRSACQNIIPVDVVREVERSRPKGHQAHQSCVYLSNALCIALGKRGYTPRLQAGSAFWRIADESAELPWFGYEFDCETDEQFRAIRQTIQDGALPELHCWVALPDTGIIIDPTYGDQPVQAKRLQGLDWTYERPSRGEWKVFGADDHDVQARYMPHFKAIQLVQMVLGNPVPTEGRILRYEQETA